MKKSVLFILGFILLQLHMVNLGAQGKEKGLDAITKASVEAQLSFLSSDWMEGRSTGTKGEYMSGDYIASMFKLYGLKPGGDEVSAFQGRGRRQVAVQRGRTYFQTIPFIESTMGDGMEMAIINESKDGSDRNIFNYRTDFMVSGAEVSTEKTVPVVFVGYGLVADSLGYNDYKGVDVKGKIVLRMAGYPGRIDSNSLAFKRFRPGNRMAEYRLRAAKNYSAIEAGAIGVIEVVPGADPSKDWASNVPFRYNSTFYEGEKNPNQRKSLRIMTDSLGRSVINITLSLRAVNTLLSGTGINLGQVESRIAQTQKPESKILAGKKLYVKTSVESRIIAGRNVVGVLEGEDLNDIIVVGGHYDHLGMLDGFIFNGADDNASGTVGVMEIAKAFTASGVKPKKTIVFAAWTGEEEGLWGSKYFVDHPYRPLSNIVMNLNFDMISRDEDDDTQKNKCTMTYTKAYGSLKEIAQNNFGEFKLNLQIHYNDPEKPSGGSDFAPFAAKNIPIIYWEAAMHKDYHTPFDSFEKTNTEKMTNIIKMGYLTVWDIANQDGMLMKK